MRFGDFLSSAPKKRKRGPVQAPFFIIDAPKPVTESRIGSGHPGKPIFVKLSRKEQVSCQGIGLTPIFKRLLKRQRLDEKVTGKHWFRVVRAYKIPQELARVLHSLGAGVTAVTGISEPA